MMLRLKLWLASIGAFIVALFAAYWNGRRDVKANSEVKELNEYIETRKRIDEVDSDTANSSREWLRSRGER
jgi:hypothetical protein